MILRRILSILFTTVLPFLGWAQGIVQVGIPQAEDQKTNARPTGRTKAVTLPFWDDFSETKTSYADPAKWLYGKSITVNDGLAIRPPSVRVATFDGVDSVGKPYNVTDVLAKGYADKLVSQPMDLTTIDIADRDSVYFSYKYQLRGNGEMPDVGDRFILLFRDQLGQWTGVDTVENDGSQDPTLFYRSIVHITESKYFHPNFQFRFQNFARLSGPYDTWHLDYIYLNKGKQAFELSFPDRTISEQTTSLLGLYRSIPLAHYIKAPTISAPTISATSQKIGDDAAQPIQFSNTMRVTYWQGATGTTMGTQTLDVNTQVPVNPQPLKLNIFTPLPAQSVPDLKQIAIDNTADSLLVDYTFWLESDDNIIQTPTEGDYIPAIFSPIDFRHNDTTYSSFFLGRRYAYDDGVSEYGAGLNQAGAQIAYEYNLVGVDTASITRLDMYFPRFGGDEISVFELRIWDALDVDRDPIYAEKVTLQRSQQNVFWMKKLTRPVKVKTKFYIGWKQDVPAVIAAGLDKSSDTGDKMFYNVNGEWIQNTTIKGNLMLRPVIGKGTADDNVGLEDELNLTVYPNPSNGSFRFGGAAEKILVYDMTGRSTPVFVESTTEETIVTLSNSSTGIYIMKVYANGIVRTAKVLVR